MNRTFLTPSRERPGKGALVLLACLVATLLACGKIQEKIAEKAAEKAVERATGQNVDLKDGRVTVKDDKGNTTEWGAGTKLPDGWPAALGPYPGAKLLGAYAARQNDKLSGSITMTTSDAPAAVLAHYAKQLPDFRLKQEVNMNGIQTKILEKDGRTVTVSCMPKDKETQATLLVANF